VVEPKYKSLPLVDEDDENNDIFEDDANTFVLAFQDNLRDERKVCRVNKVMQPRTYLSMGTTLN